MVMARPRLQPLWQDPPLPSAPSPSPPSPSPFSPSPLSPQHSPLARTGVNGWWRGIRVSLCILTAFRVMSFPHARLRFLLNRRHNLPAFYAPFLHRSNFHVEFRHIFRETHHPILILPPGITLTPNQVPKHHQGCVRSKNRAA